MGILLSKSSMPIVKVVAEVFGYLMSAIFNALNFIGIPNIGLSIILFTIIMYALMTPLQIRQQKFSRLNAVMTPEIQKIQKKYRGKKDQLSIQKMQDETRAVYKKYGVSASGSCVQLLIQFPVILGLYQVILYIPGYVKSIRDIFDGVVSNMMNVDGLRGILSSFLEGNNVTRYILPESLDKNAVIDFLYKLSPSQWNKLENIKAFSGFKGAISEAASGIQNVNSFLGLNLADTPFNVIKSNIGKGGSILLVIGAILIPLLAWFTQRLNYKLIPQATSSSGEQSTMESTMKSVNTFMPIMSAVFCFSFSVGIGVYWIIGAVVRSIQQIIINKYMDKIGVDQILKQNKEKAEKEREKSGIPPKKITQQAKRNVRNIEMPKNAEETETDENSNESTADVHSSVTYKEGSIAAKANMVKQYNDKHGKK